MNVGIIIVSLFAIFTLLNCTICRQISLITLKVDMEILSRDYNNYYVAFLKTKLILLSENLDLFIVSLAIEQLSTWNLVSVEAHCQVSVERLTPQLCSQG